MARLSVLLVGGVLALHSATHVLARPWTGSGAPDQRLPLAGPRAPHPPSSPRSSESCLACGRLYATAFVLSELVLVEIDLPGRTSRVLGILPNNAVSLALTTEGRLFAAGAAGELYRIDSCTLAADVPLHPPFEIGLTGDVFGTGLLQGGPPLRRIDAENFNVQVVGGTIGPSPPEWCTAAFSDLAHDPADGRLFAMLDCPGCGLGSDFVAVDTATGDVTQIGCSPVGPGIGLAHDGDGELYHINVSSRLLHRLDKNTGAVLEAILISAPFPGGFRTLASYPCHPAAR